MTNSLRKPRMDEARKGREFFDRISTINKIRKRVVMGVLAHGHENPEGRPQISQMTQILKRE